MAKARKSAARKSPARKAVKRKAPVGASRKPGAGNLDPVTLEVIRNALPAVANEMAVDLQRTSYNMMIYEVRDFCTALIDTQGQLIPGQNKVSTSWLISASSSPTVRATAPRAEPGDVLITNHQAVAGQHLNNIVIYMLLFPQGRAPDVRWRAHWIITWRQLDWIRGRPQVVDPRLEGLQLDQLEDLQGRQLDETLYRVLGDEHPVPESAARRHECNGGFASGWRPSAWTSCSTSTQGHHPGRRRPYLRRDREPSAATWCRSCPTASTRPLPPWTTTACSRASRCRSVVKVTIHKGRDGDRPVGLLEGAQGGDQFAHARGRPRRLKALTGPLDPGQRRPVPGPEDHPGRQRRT